MKHFIFFTLFALSCLANAKPAERIITLAPHIVETLFEIGAGDKIIATVDYSDHPEQALSIPRIGGYYGLQMERIVAMQPDLIIGWQSGNRAEDLQQIADLGLPLVHSHGGDIEDIAAEVIQLGELTGKQKKAQQVADKFTQQLANIRAKYQHKKPVRVFYQLWSEPLMTINKDSWIHQLLEVCGGENVFANAPTEYPQISIENVLVAAPDVIIMPDEKADKPQPKIDWEKWPSIPAVKHQRSIRANADLLHRFSTRLLLGLEDMCEKIDKFRVADLQPSTP